MPQRDNNLTYIYIFIDIDWHNDIKGKIERTDIINISGKYQMKKK